MISPIPLRDFAFSGSQKLKNLLASQGRRLKAGVAKDLGGVHPEARDVAVTPQCGGTHSVRVRPFHGHTTRTVKNLWRGLVACR